MRLAPGVSLLQYRLHDKIGQGGMGEVWEATDTTLDRRVAIKVLPEPLAANPERLARLEREAKLLASLNHPNIAAVYGLHEAEGTRFLAMELVPGEDLMARLDRGPVPVEDALPLALQVAEGLEAAHEHGVIHRDLKPANLVVDPEGRVKILDFGLAKALDPEAGSGDSSMMATVTTPATQTGVILGTAAYMCPEQARGRAVDKRADIWAFGVVLWEMLTGARLFTGETVSDTLASVLKERPDPAALPAGTPARVRELLGRCLEKDPRKRLRDIGEARILLARAIASPGEVVEPPGGVVAPTAAIGRRRVPPATAAGILLAGLALGAGAAWLLRPASRPVEAPTYHLSIGLPADKPVATRVSRPVAISPDGRRIVYVSQSGDSTRLFTRTLDRDEVREIPGTESGIDPFFSPDGSSLGFLDQASRGIKRVALGGVAPTTFLDTSVLVGSIWGPDGRIYYTPIGPGGGDQRNSILRIAATGGKPEVVAAASSPGGELHLWPDLLPGGKTLLYAAVKGLDFGKAQIRAVDLDTHREKVILPNAQLARFVPPGHLVYLQGGTILATRFDPRAVEIVGNPAVALADVLTNPDSGSAGFAFSRAGTLVYVSGTAAETATVVVGADREGHVRRLIAESGDYLSLSASPVADRIAVARQDKPGSHDVWVHDLRRGTFARLSTGGTGLGPVWTRDGRWVYFTEQASATAGRLMRVRPDGSTAPEVVRELPGFDRATSISPDGTWLLASHDGATSTDVVLVPLEGTGEPRPFVATEANELSAAFSPDGKLVAYLSDQGGELEVTIRPFPGPGEAWRIPGPGATALAWAPGGREVLFLQGTDVMAVSLGSGAEIQPGTPRKRFTFEGAPIPAFGLGGPAIDLLPDGTIVSIRPAGAASGPTQIQVVLNWFTELDRLLP